ncbi:MAG: calcium-binding protein, partial [Planctomycetota bacterium]
MFLGGGADDLMLGDGDSVVFADTSSVTYDSSGNVIAASSDPDGGDGDDELILGDGSKIVFLGGGNDDLTMGDGDVILFGDHGDITLNASGDVLSAVSTDDAGDAGDMVTLGDGEKLIFLGGGADTLTSGNGDSIVFGDNGSAILNVDSELVRISIPGGSDGADTITLGDGNDEVRGGAGDDIIDSGAGADLIFGESGVDIITAGLGSDEVHGGTEGDTIFGGVNALGTSTETGSQDKLIGGEDDDVIWGDYGADLIEGGEGFDIIHGLPGDDRILGGTESDDIWGDAGNDIIVGGRGDDTIAAGDGDDLVWGGEEDIAASFFDRSDPSNFEAPPGFNSAEARVETGYMPAMITPVIAFGQSIGSNSDDNPANIDDHPFARERDDLLDFTEFSALHANLDILVEDFNDVISGGEGSDLIFGGGGRDALFGGGGSDYVDGGVERDEVYGEGGDDIVRGGANDDVVHGDYMYEIGSSRADAANPLFGDEGIDQVYGDGGSDFLFGDAGRNEGTVENPDWVQKGQRLWGGDGIDFMYAFANVGVTAPKAEIDAEVLKWGDELHGGAGGDWLYGNLRQDVLFGDSGNEYIAGDFLAGPQLAQNEFANLIGGDDLILGGSGEDQLLGGGGNDEIWGGANTDWLEGQDGDDTLYGGTDIDIMVLDTRREYFAPDGVGEADELPSIDQLDSSLDTFDGFFGNEFRGDLGLDDATDIMLIEGTNQDDKILIGQLADGRIHVNFSTVNPFTGADESWQILAPWRANITDPATTQDYFDPLLPLNPVGAPLVEQFRISGLMRDDDISFVADPYVAFEGTPAAVNVLPLDIGDLNARSDDFVGVIDGGPGDDDGGSGSDTIFGLAGDDRLWGDSTAGEETASTFDYDIIFGGRGDDDLIGGPGINDLYAWTQDPQPEGDTQFGVYVAEVDDPDNPGSKIPDPIGPVFDDNGDLDGDGFLDSDGVTPKRVLENTGLDRMLGSRNADRLFGGTEVSFLFGNGGDDQLFRVDGTQFQSADGGINGDEWKQFVLTEEPQRVWYVAGSEADDVITVDFVNEPGLLGDHHLVTRLTDNNGVFTFAADVNLDFNATDDDGNPLWDGADVVLNIQQLQQRGAGQDPDTPDASLPTTAFATETIGLNSGVLLEGLLPNLLPPEGDFDVILIDALGGDDHVSVGPTVQKTVWIDAGAGNDRVTIAGGKVVLADRAEFLEVR